MPYLVIALGGALGANVRYIVNLLAGRWLGATFPYGTLGINITGSLVLGFFLTLATERLEIDPLWRLFFATGFLGAYTTFSAYTYESLLLLREGAYVPALAYLVGSVLGGLGGAALGIAAARSW
ncbi:MAG: fluoride efflux transporter CrcB [Chloroflexi bacterium]|nr:fluoride efflux transporter CrcB [Chloroflexota bacterium]